MIDWKAGELIRSEYLTSGRTVVDLWEVVEEGVIKVLECSPHFSTYLDVGEIYHLNKHHPRPYLQVWEIPVENTKRPDSCSQVLLFDWNDRPDAKPNMEIDS